MEPTVVVLAAAVAVALVALLALRLLRHRRRHKMTKAGLRKRAIKESEALTALIDEHVASSRPADGARAEYHERAHWRATLPDEELRSIYRRAHISEVAELREQLAERGIRDEALDRVYESAWTEADLRTISTALLVMANRLR